MPSLGGGGKYGGDDVDGRDRGPKSNADKYDDYDYYDDDSYRDAGGHRDALPPPGDNSGNAGRHDGRDTRERKSNSSGGGAPRRATNPTGNLAGSRRETAQATYADTNSSLSGMDEGLAPRTDAQRQGGNFGGYDGQGSTNKNDPNGPETVKDALKKQAAVRDFAESAAQARNTGGLLGSMINPAAPSVDVGRLNIGTGTIVNTATNTMNKKKLHEALDNPDMTPKDKAQLEAVYGTIYNAKPSVGEKLASLGIGAGVTALTGGNVYAGMMANRFANSIFQDKATRKAADRYRTPEEIAARDQKQARIREEAKNFPGYGDNSKDSDSFSSEGLLTSADNSAASTNGASAIAMPSYNFNYKTHLNRFSI